MVNALDGTDFGAKFFFFGGERGEPGKKPNVRKLFGRFTTGGYKTASRLTPKRKQGSIRYPECYSSN